MQHKGSSITFGDEQPSFAFSLQGLSGTIGIHIINSIWQVIFELVPSGPTATKHFEGLEAISLLEYKMGYSVFSLTWIESGTVWLASVG